MNTDEKLNGELLIVEDDDSVRTFLRLELEPEYTIREAANGEQALRQLEEQLPDLVVSDIMMPDMDGLELCRRIKSNDETFHIPVILLTARKSQEYQMEGLETGADAYVTKPFSMDLLSIRIRKLIESRRRFRDQYSSVLFQPPSPPERLSSDEILIRKAKDVVEQHMEDEAFDIEYFAREMKLHRRTLYRKMKAIVKEPPMLFVRTIRLEKAREMISSGQVNVSEAAWQVGFSDLSYFTKCFKAQHGKTPSEYLPKR